MRQSARCCKARTPQPAARQISTGGRTNSTSTSCIKALANSNPMGDDFDYAAEFNTLDLAA